MQSYCSTPFINGKFAANPARYMEYIIDDYGSSTPESYSPDAIYGKKQLYSKPLEEFNQRYYNVAVAASITGWVRAHLWQAIQKVDTPIYCDTDSIMCKDIGSLKLGDELGDWTMEGRATKIVIAGKKLYTCKLTPEFKTAENKGWKSASKGVRLTPQEIIKVAKGGTVTYENDAPTFSFKRDTHFLKRTIAPRLVA